MSNPISEGTAVLGIEFGSTRIKSVLIDRDHKVVASGSHESYRTAGKLCRSEAECSQGNGSAADKDRSNGRQRDDARISSL